MDLSTRLKHIIVDVPDFPKPGILFKDITPIFDDPKTCALITQHIVETFPDIDAIAGIESRGFFWGMLVAQVLEIPFIPIRKAGKLPRPTLSQSYALEYGTATLEIHQDTIQPGTNVLIHDDLLATGGTAFAAAQLINQVGHCVGFSFLVELAFLEGRQRLEEFTIPVDAIAIY
ncbi:MAG: adenine phosphoribosyltransferase [Saprospiraceae bacterium]